MTKTPDQPFVRTENVAGRETVRVAVADRMVNQGCVNCHNTRPDSPKHDWKIGDLCGVLEVTMPVDKQLEANTRMLMGVGVAAGVVSASRRR